MGYAENKKLAKDINNNTSDCVELLKDTLELLATKTELMNELVLAISQKYPAKSYIDAGDDAQQKKLEELLTQTENQRYVGSDNTRTSLSFYTGSIRPGNSERNSGSFDANYDGVIRLIIPFEATVVSYTNNFLRANVYETNTLDGSSTASYTLDIGAAPDTVNRATLNINVNKGCSYYLGLRNILGSGSSYATIADTGILVCYDIVTG